VGFRFLGVICRFPCRHLPVSFSEQTGKICRFPTLALGLKGVVIGASFGLNAGDIDDAIRSASHAVTD
jgi:hypothetical protein